MVVVGIRALKQNASAVVAKVAEGESVIITDRGRPVAEMTPVSSSALQRLIATGRVRPARRSITSLPAPKPGANISADLAADREGERY